MRTVEITFSGVHDMDAPIIRTTHPTFVEFRSLNNFQNYRAYDIGCVPKEFAEKPWSKYQPN